MHAIGTAVLEFALEQPHLYSDLVEDKGRSNNAGAVECIAEWLASDHRERSEEIALVVWAHCHGLLSLFSTGRLQMAEGDFRVAYDRSLRSLAGLYDRRTLERTPDKPGPAR